MGLLGGFQSSRDIPVILLAHRREIGMDGTVWRPPGSSARAGRTRSGRRDSVTELDRDLPTALLMSRVEGLLRLFDRVHGRHEGVHVHRSGVNQVDRLVK
jgi:hypothetical protein